MPPARRPENAEDRYHELVERLLESQAQSQEKVRKDLDELLAWRNRIEGVVLLLKFLGPPLVLKLVWDLVRIGADAARAFGGGG